MNKMQKLINEIEKTISEMPKEVYVWGGSGYVLDTLDVTDYLEDRNDISVEEVAMLCVKNNCGLIISEDGYEDLVKEIMYYDKKNREERQEELDCQWYYVDLTPWDVDIKRGYLLIDNLRCSDNIEIHS